MSIPNYEDFLQFEAQRRGWDDRNVARWEEWRKAVGEVESGNSPTRTQGDRVDGIGRGKYQYETLAGSGTNLTAKNRLSAFLDLYGYSLDDLPRDDRVELQSSNPDFSRLSEDVQDLAFLADKSLASETRLNDLVTGNYDPAEAWTDWHWKGDSSSKPTKIRQWNSNAGYNDPSSDYEWSFNRTSNNELKGGKDWLDELFGSVKDFFR